MPKYSKVEVFKFIDVILYLLHFDYLTSIKIDLILLLTKAKVIQANV